MTHPDTRSPEVVGVAGALLRTRRIGRAFRAHESVTSTNTLAAEWAEGGAHDGSVVFAEFQTEGRGRMGRSWHAQPGLNLLFSIVLRPTLAPDRLGMIGVAAGLAVAEALDGFTSPVRSAIRWPNDVLLNGRKCSGILLESRWSTAARPSAVVLGIGINVNQVDFPLELEDIATSLLLETGLTIRREEVLAAVLNRLEERLDQLSRADEAVRKEYLGRMAQLNVPIRLRFAGGRTISGVATDLDESGGLVLRTANGEEVFHAGEVTHLP